jgi:hypothetical protein
VEIPERVVMGTVAVNESPSWNYFEGEKASVQRREIGKTWPRLLVDFLCLERGWVLEENEDKQLVHPFK